jgi:hypothetical protein
MDYVPHLLLLRFSDFDFASSVIVAGMVLRLCLLLICPASELIAGDASEVYTASIIILVGFCNGRGCWPSALFTPRVILSVIGLALS